MHVKDLDFCELLCYQHDDCVSLNIKKDPDSATGQQECELNNSTHLEHDGDLTNDNAYLYRSAKVIILELPVLSTTYTLIVQRYTILIPSTDKEW